MTLAVRIAYFGHQFKGFAKQPGQRTVEGTIVTALEKIGGSALASTLKFSSRTDSGVNAFSNVITFDPECKDGKKMEPDEMVRAMNAYMRHVWGYSFVVVKPEFEPRDAASRTYVYNLLVFEKMDKAGMEAAAKAFEGEHDFSAFSKRDDTRDVNPVRKVTSCKVLEGDGFFLIEVKAPNFLWEMVRRMAAAIANVGSGKVKTEDIVRLLEPSKHEGGPDGAREEAGRVFGVAPAGNMTLLDVSYEPPIVWCTNGTIISQLEDLLTTQFEEADMAVFFRNGLVGYLNNVVG